MAEFAGKAVLVTGSSSGIGEATAAMFAARGADVTLCGRDEARLQGALDKARAAGQAAGHSNRFLAVAGDVTRPEVRQEMVSKTVSTFGRLDVLVVNHGVTAISFGLDTETEESFDKVFDANVKAVLFLVKVALPHLEKSQGCVVVTSSVASVLPAAFTMSYHMSKAAVDHMVRCLALDLAPKGIRVNAINPTLVHTRLTRDADTTQFDDVRLFVEASHPLHGRASDVDEQAEVILFLASRAARFVTGECIMVDGGVTQKGYPLNYYTPPSSSEKK